MTAYLVNPTLPQKVALQLVIAVAKNGVVIVHPGCDGAGHRLHLIRRCAADHQRTGMPDAEREVSHQPYSVPRSPGA